MDLQTFVRKHTARNACRCGQCMVPGTDQPLPEHTANVVFFEVSALDSPRKEELIQAVKSHTGVYKDFDLFSGDEYTYIDIGHWAGDQELGLLLMGLGALLDIWTLQTPYTLPGGDSISQQRALELAGMGMVSITARKSSGS